MKKLKAVITLFLVFAMLLPSGIVLAADTRPSSWAEAEVSQAQKLGLIPTGMRNEYQSPITRLEFCQMSMQFLETKTQMPVEQYISDKQIKLPSAFADCSDVRVLQASALGITNGRGDNKFAPNASITREEAATMLYRVNTAIYGTAERMISVSVSAFNDSSRISSWARDGITFAVRTANAETGIAIMQGTGNDRFSPAANYTIEQSILTMVRMFNATQYAERGVLIDNSSNLNLRTVYPWFDTWNWSSPKAGKVFPAASGGSTLVMLTLDGAVVYHLDNKLGVTGKQPIALELEQVVGAHRSDNGDYFLAYIADNKAESRTREVLRIVKYDSNWRRIGSASVSAGDAGATLITDAGTLSMADNGSVLTVHTSRERFVSSDGLNHQSNLTVSFDINSLNRLYISPDFPTNHVSHSFNQDALYDGNKLVLIDHGDAYPRSLLLTITDPTVRTTTTSTLFSIPGITGDNFTGVTQGNLVMTNANYIVSYNTIDQIGRSNTERNAFLALVPRSGNSSAVTTIPLTNFTANSGKLATAPQLVALNVDRVAVLWEVHEHSTSYNLTDVQTYYVVVDANGKAVGPVQTTTRRILAEYPAAFVNGKLLAPAPITVGGAQIYINEFDLSMFDLGTDANTSPVTDITPVEQLTLAVGGTLRPEFWVTEGGTRTKLPLSDFTVTNVSGAITVANGAITSSVAGNGTMTLTYKGFSVTLSVTAREKRASSITVAPAYRGATDLTLVLRQGEVIPAAFTVTYDDNTNGTVSIADVTLTTSYSAYMNVTSAGAVGIIPGTYALSVQYAGLTVSVIVEIEAASPSDATTGDGTTFTMLKPKLSLVGSTGSVLAAGISYGSLGVNPATYTSSNPDVVYVNTQGQVIAMAPGTATVTATVNGVSDSVSFTITDQISQSPAYFDFGDLTLSVGQTHVLAPDITSGSYSAYEVIAQSNEILTITTAEHELLPGVPMLLATANASGTTDLTIRITIQARDIVHPTITTFYAYTTARVIVR